MGFSDFLRRENLQPFEDNPKKFRDIKYGFEFLHDVENDLETDYEVIVNKYARRIARFEQTIKSPTIFFRSIRDIDDKNYVLGHYQEIDRILKKYNSNNRIVYLFPESLGKISDDIEYFIIEAYPSDEALIRDIFDHTPGLLRFCEGCFSTEAITANKNFDKETNETCAAEIYSLMQRDDPRVWQGILSLLDAKRSEGIFLWGAGHHGKAMYKYLRKNAVMIKGIIDSNKSGVDFEGRMILLPDDVRKDNKIFISITDRGAVKDIRNKVQSRVDGIKIADYYDLRQVIK